MLHFYINIIVNEASNDIVSYYVGRTRRQPWAAFFSARWMATRHPSMTSRWRLIVPCVKYPAARIDPSSSFSFMRLNLNPQSCFMDHHPGRLMQLFISLLSRFGMHLIYPKLIPSEQKKKWPGRKRENEAIAGKLFWFSGLRKPCGCPCHWQ